ncbi:MAG: radical SAM family heme chaperone HemW [Pseudomonadota bacterium]
MSVVTPPLGVYVHWPYCARICPYCDFNVYKQKPVDAALWRDAFSDDLRYWAARLEGRPLRSLYFGGGTPSLAPPGIIDGVIETCADVFGFEPDAEITLEANPTDAEQSLFRSFAKAGVNRLSLGAQSLRDEALQFLGRDHGAEEAKRAIALASEIFPRVTFDLIYARAGQRADDWMAELDEALSFNPGHLSLYQLTIEPGTAFDIAVERGRWAPASEDDAAAMFDQTNARLESAGLPNYEVSNYAAETQRSQHNLLYWTGADYIGVGPGAHGRITEGEARLATLAPTRPEAYLNAAAPRANVSSLSARDRLVERFAMGLRLTEGLPLRADDVFFKEPHAHDALQNLVGDGLLICRDERLAATPSGRRVLNGVLDALLNTAAHGAD